MLLRVDTEDRRRAGEAAGYVGAVAEAIFGPSRRGVWLMLSSYFDASNTHAGSSVRVLAGLVSTPEQWEKLSDAWREALDKEELKDFHATDCVKGYPPFDQDNGWGPDRRLRLYRRLTHLVARGAAWRVWSAIKMDDYIKTFEHDQTGKGTFYVNAFSCASDLRALSLEEYQGAHIAYMFDRGDRGSNLAFEAFDELLDNDKHDYYRMGTLSKDKRQNFPPLQAADLHAYEVYRYLAGVVAGERLPMRPELEELTIIPETGGQLWRERTLRGLFGTYWRRYGENSGKQEREPIIVPRDSLDRIGPNRRKRR